MKKKHVVLCLVAFLVGLFLIAGHSPAAAEKTLNIGAIWGLSGPGSQLGVVCKDASLLAAKWINDRGGVTIRGERYKIKLFIEDNKNSAPGSVNAATKLVDQRKVKFIVGLNVPFQIQAVQSITEHNKVVLSAGKLSHLNPKNRYTFSSTNGYMVPYPALYRFMLEKYPEVKRVGYTAQDEPGALATLEVARAVAKKHDLELLEPVLTQFGTKDYYSAWTKVLKNKPDAVDIGIGFPDCLGIQTRQGRELGFKGPILTCGTGDSNVMIHLIGKDWATDFISATFDVHASNCPEMIKKIMWLWEKELGKPFNVDALDGWSSVWALVQAIEKAQSLDPDEVVHTWENMKTIDTPWGPGTMGGKQTFGINHMVLAPVPVSRVMDGHLESTQWTKPVLP